MMIFSTKVVLSPGAICRRRRRRRRRRGRITIKNLNLMTNSGHHRSIIPLAAQEVVDLCHKTVQLDPHRVGDPLEEEDGQPEANR
jgi:hypothetical protein